MATTAYERHPCWTMESVTTPKRQSIAAPLCPGAPKKIRTWSSAVNAEATSMGCSEPVWTLGKPLESFEFGDAQLIHEAYFQSSFPQVLSDLPLLGEKKSLVEQPSPYMSALRKRGRGWLFEDMEEVEPIRRLRRLKSQRQLKFHTPPLDVPLLPFVPSKDAEVPECAPEDSQYVPDSFESLASRLKRCKKQDM